MQKIKFKKQNIVFLVARLENVFETEETMQLLKDNYKKLNYPFGVTTPITYSRPTFADGYFYLTASVNIDPMKYIKKCCNSFYPSLQNIGQEYVKQYFPELLDSYITTKNLHIKEREVQMMKNHIGESNETE